MNASAPSAPPVPLPPEQADATPASPDVRRILVLPGLGPRTEEDVHDSRRKVTRALNKILGHTDPSPATEIIFVDYHRLLRHSRWKSYAKQRHDGQPPRNRAQSRNWQCKCCRRQARRGLLARMKQQGVRAMPDSTADRLVRRFYGHEYRIVRAFLSRPDMRADFRRVVDDVARTHPDIIIAHSFGSLVAVDYLTHAPHQPELLLTIASPMSAPLVSTRLQQEHYEWIASQATAWVNVHDRRDFATGTRLLGPKRFPNVINLRIGNDSHHSLRESLRHRAVVNLISDVLTGARTPQALIGRGKKKPMRDVSRD